MSAARERFNEEVGRLREQLRQEETDEKNREVAELTRKVYQSYIDAGFTEDQAWEIFITLLKK